MIKKVYLVVLSVLLAQGIVGAQIEMAVPNGSFEQWSSHPGYSVTAIFIPVSVYSSYSTPTGWDYLTYPVNETFSSITINTNLPLIKASQETGVVPDGNSALKLQTFMLSDIISSTAYSMASGSLDPSLTNEVYPSILSTGVVDIEHFIPIMNSMMSDMDDIGTLLATFSDIDINYIITGGLPLNGFEPTRLTGYYKYHSAVNGDNGGVVVLGTHYNSTLHKRDLVGAGVNISLTDCTDYAPFTVDYMSLHDYDETYAKLAPDSLIIMLVSSASTNRQQGSYLCVDNLALWHDTCASIVNFVAEPDIHEAVLSWGTAASVDGFEMEFGATGFTQGNGTVITPNGNTYTFDGLAANTQYDVYVRTVCSNNIYGDWAMLTFTTLPDTCTSVLGLEVVATPDIPAEYSLMWSGSSEPEAWELEYGLRGFTHGNGTVMTLEESGLDLAMLDLLGNNWYDFYVRSVCADNIYGEWSMVQFHTDPDTCAQIIAIEMDTTGISITADGLVSGYVVSWTSSFDPDVWEVEYGEEGFEQGSGIAAVVQLPSISLAPLQPDSQYELRVRTVCNDSIHGDWVSTAFHTRDTIPAVSIDNSQHSFSEFCLSVFPNPAHGQCEVVLSDGLKKAELKLFSLDGRLLQSVAAHDSMVTLQLPSQGVFLLQVTTAQGSLTRKIVNR